MGLWGPPESLTAVIPWKPPRKERNMAALFIVNVRSGSLPRRLREAHRCGSPSPRLLLLPRLLLTQLCGGLGSTARQPGLATAPLCPCVMSSGTTASLTGWCCEEQEAPQVEYPFSQNPDCGHQPADFHEDSVG